MSLLAKLKELLRDKSLDPPPPAPPGWNKTLDDLDAEKRSLSGHEMHWAREYEREQLRSWARFPKDGEVYEAKEAVELTYSIDWRAPYSSGGTGAIPAGTRLRVALFAHDPEPIGVYATPLNDKEIEALLVPEDDRLSKKYGGYSLFIKTARLNREFIRVETAAESGGDAEPKAGADA